MCLCFLCNARLRLSVCPTKAWTSKAEKCRTLFCGAGLLFCGVATATTGHSLYPTINTLSMFWTISMYPWKEASYVQFFSHRHRTLFVPSVLFCSKYSGDKESHPATAAPCPGGMRRELRQVSRGSGGQPGFPCGEGPRICFVSSMNFSYCFFFFLQGAVCFMFAQVCCALLQYCTM